MRHANAGFRFENWHRNGERQNGKDGARHAARLLQLAFRQQPRIYGNERCREDAFAEKVLPRVPMRRWGKPEDFGGIAVYLASDASAYHSGDTFVIDGGYMVF